MIDLSKYENIIFDFGGVILNIDPNLTHKEFGRLSGEDINHLYSQKQNNIIFDLLETGEISPKDFRSEINKILGTKLTDLEIDTAWNKMLIDLPLYRLKFLEEIRRKRKTFLLSNTNAIHEKQFDVIVKNLDTGKKLNDYFDGLYYSHHIGYRKPNVLAFEYVVKKHNLEISETIFIDDTEQNIKGAKSLGLDTYLLHVEKEDITKLFM